MVMTAPVCWPERCLFFFHTVQSHFQCIEIIKDFNINKLLQHALFSTIPRWGGGHSNWSWVGMSGIEHQDGGLKN